jgi:hypothetical protein
MVNFSKVIIWANYELNKAQITKDYCVNKDKPMMHCCGKCKLKKQLAEDEQKQKSPAMSDVKNDIQLFGSPIYSTLYNIEGAYFLINSPYTDVCHPGTHTAVFHPPTV